MLDNAREQLGTIWAELLDPAQRPGAATASAPVADAADFFLSGGTSVTAVYLAARIQEHFRVSVDALEVVMNPTFGELFALVAQRLSQEPGDHEDLLTG